MTDRTRLNRRQLLKSLSICAAGGASGLGSLLAARRGIAQTQPGKPYFLIVIPAVGGASIIDSFLAIRHSETANWQNINTFPDNLVVDVAGSPFRAVNQSGSGVGSIPIPFTANQSAFVQKHKDDLMVATVTGTSVNHRVAQKRSLTGNEAWRGRTLQEVIAAQYGAGFPLPNVNMSVDGYIQRGTDDSLPAYAFHEPVANALVWPLGLDGSKGLLGVPDRALIEKARQIRNDKLDIESTFARTYRKSERLALWREQRAEPQKRLEMEDLITKLLFVPDSQNTPLSQYGLSESPDGAKVRARFPRFASDPLHAQACLAFLLLKNRVSTTVTLSPSFSVLIDGFNLSNPPLAFDFSHNAHRATQALMWQRMLNVADGLIDLLKEEEFDSTTHESYWDRTMIYFATEFGRDRRRQNGADEFGSAHNLNNGYAILSPLVRGNTVLGGVDKDTGLTYGFDPQTGDPTPGRNNTEAEIYAGLLQALKVDTAGSGLPDVPAMRR